MDGVSMALRNPGRFEDDLTRGGRTENSQEEIIALILCITIRGNSTRADLIWWMRHKNHQRLWFRSRAHLSASANFRGKAKITQAREMIGWIREHRRGRSCPRWGGESGLGNEASFFGMVGFYRNWMWKSFWICIAFSGGDRELNKRPKCVWLIGFVFESLKQKRINLNWESPWLGLLLR